jgi:hypothetical protein
MPITTQCTCGQQFMVPDDLVGRRVQCPGCQRVLLAPGGDGGDAVPEPREDRESRRRRKREESPSGNKNTWILVGGIGGAVLLLSCCCIGGIASYFLFLAGPGDPEKVIIGRWIQTHDAFIEVNMATLEYKQDGSFRETTMMFANTTGKWKMLSKTGNTIKIEETYQQTTFPNQQMTYTRQREITFVNNNRFEIKSGTGAPSIYKRMD